MEAKVTQAIEVLVERAKKEATPSHDAMHLTQAALNLAHTLQVLQQTTK